jgi:hypothetical protein
MPRATPVEGGRIYEGLQPVEAPAQTAASYDAVVEDYGLGTKDLSQDLTSKPYGQVDPELAELLGDDLPQRVAVMQEEANGEIVDKISFLDLSKDMQQRLFRREVRALQAVGKDPLGLSQEERIEMVQRIKDTANYHAARKINQETIGVQGLDPLRAVTKEADTKDLAERGLTPEGHGNIAGGLRTAQDYMLEATEGLVEEDSLVRKALDWAAPGAVSDEGAFGQIPEAIRNPSPLFAGMDYKMPLRQYAAMAYPYSGYEVGRFNLLTKAAQDFFTPVVAVQDVARKIMEEQPELSHSEAAALAMKDPRSITPIRENKATFDYALDDHVRFTTSPLWLGMRVLHGGNIYDTAMELAGVDLRGATKGADVAPLALMSAAVPFFGPNAAAKVGGDLMTEEDSEAMDFFGAMGTAMLTPDILVGAASGAKGAWKGLKGLSNTVRTTRMEKAAVIVDELVEGLAKADGDITAEASAIDGALEKLRFFPEARAGVMDRVGNALNARQQDYWGPTLERLTKNSERAQTKLDKMMRKYRAPGVPEDLVAAGEGIAKAEGTLSIAEAGKLQLRGYAFEFARAGGAPTETVKQVANLEVKAAQQKHAALRIFEALIESSVDAGKVAGTLAKGAKTDTVKAMAAVSDYVTSAKTLEGAIAELYAKGTPEAQNAVDAALAAFNKATRGMASSNAGYVTRALELSLETARAARSAAGADLVKLYGKLPNAGWDKLEVQAAREVHAKGVEKLLDAPKHLDRAGRATAHLQATAKGMAESFRAGAEVIRGGGTLPLRQAFVPEVARLKGLPAEEQLAGLERAFGGTTLKAMAGDRGVAQLVRGEALSSPKLFETSQRLSTLSSADPFSAWSLAIEAERRTLHRLFGAQAVVRGTEMIEQTLRRMDKWALFKKFGFGSDDLLNIMRKGEANGKLGLGEFSDAVIQARKAAQDAGESSTARVSATIDTFVEGIEYGGTSLFRAGGMEPPIVEWARAMRLLGPDQARNTASFQAVSNAYVKSGEPAKQALEAPQARLLKLLFDEGFDPATLRMEDLVEVTLKPLGRVGAADLKGRAYAAAGIINGASMWRTFEDVLNKTQPFGPEAMDAAIRLAKSETGAVVKGDVALASSMLKELGIPPRAMRDMLKTATAGSDKATLVQLGHKNLDEFVLDAFVPRNFINTMDSQISHMVKTGDPQSMAQPWLMTNPVARNVQLAFLLFRRGITSGLFAPRPAHFNNNFLGLYAQIWMSAGHNEALRSAIAAGSVIHWAHARPLFTGSAPVDGRILRTMRNMAQNLKTDKVLPPPQIGYMNPAVAGIFDDAIMPSSQQFEAATGEVITKQKFIDEMVREGVLQSFADTHLIRNKDVAVALGQKQYEGLMGRVEQGLSKVEKHSERWAKLMDIAEQRQRAALFMDLRLRKGYKPEVAGHMVREAAFDWGYTWSGGTELSFLGTPLIMFGTMWENALKQTLRGLVDPAKTKRMMDVYKAGRIFEQVASDPGDQTDVERLQEVAPWYTATRSGPVLTRLATPEETASGLQFRGGTTQTMARVLPTFVNQDLTLLMANMMHQTAIFVNDMDQRPGAGKDYAEYLKETAFGFVNPMVPGLVGYEGRYATQSSRARYTAAEVAFAQTMGLGNDVTYEKSESGGGYRYYGPKRRLAWMRSVPPLARALRNLDPYARAHYGDVSLQTWDMWDFLREAALTEAGLHERPVVDGLSGLEYRDRALKKAGSDIYPKE